MVTITKVAKTQETLVEELEALGGEVTHKDEHWSWHNSRHRPIRWEIEVYFDDELSDDKKNKIQSLIDETGWFWFDEHDPAENGHRFERRLKG